MDSGTREKSVCLKYANVVFLLYDALNSMDDFKALWFVSLPSTERPLGAHGAGRWELERLKIRVLPPGQVPTPREGGRERGESSGVPSTHRSPSPGRCRHTC